MIAACMDSYSNNNSEMNLATDPNSSGAPSLATTLAGELERLRYVLKHLTGFSQWWTHFEDVNLGDRGLRVHRTLATNFHAWLRIEGHTAAANVRFHLVALSIPGYTAGTMHPESAMFLIHVGTTVRFMVGVGGDTHVGGTLGVHAAGSAHAPAVFNLQYPKTGFFWPFRDHIGITLDNTEIARFHGAGLILAPHAGVAFRSAVGGSHQMALRLRADDALEVGDPSKYTWVRGIGMTNGGNLLVGTALSGELLETKTISGTGVTITHQTGQLVFKVSPEASHITGSHVALGAQGSYLALTRHTSAVTPIKNALYADLIPKGWANFDAGGSLNASFNVSSVTDTGPGDWTVNWTTPFSSANYAAAGTVVRVDDVGPVITLPPSAQLAGSLRVWVININGTQVDEGNVGIMAVGIQ